MNYAIPVPNRTVVPVANSDAVFPVRRIYCVGRNYAAHTREMGGSPEKNPPCFFTKPADAVVADGNTIDYPQATGNLQYEVELVLAIGKGGKDLPKSTAINHVFGYAVGIDLTRRDLQKAAKDTGMPWDSGKAFDNSAPCSTIVPASEIGHPDNAAIWLSVNGETKQSSNISNMIWPVADIVAVLSTLFKLAPGDLIYTGTPEGVGPIVSGDKIEAGIKGVGQLCISIQ